MEFTLPQIYMIIFFAVYFGVIIGIRTFLLYRNTKVDAIKNFGKAPRVKNAERIIQAALLLLIMIGVNYIFISANYQYLLPIHALEIGWLQTTGFTLSMLGLVLTFIGQLQMKDSWRLGIDTEKEVQLVTTGLFSRSRNPIYLGLGIGFIGFFFIAPNLVSIIFIALMFYGVSMKIKDEEAFLLDKFGNQYKLYQSKVNRWL